MKDDDKKKPLGEEFDELFKGAVIDGTGEPSEEAPDDADLEADSVSVIPDLSEAGEEGFGEFAEVEVYDGAETGAILDEMAEGLDLKEEISDDVVVDRATGVAAGEAGIVAVEIDDSEWREMIVTLGREAEEQKDAVVAAALLTEIGRITERRLGDAAAAQASYDEALRKDPTCLPALQGKRRSLVRRGQWGAVKDALQEEKSLAQDTVIAQKIDALIGDIRLWQEGEADALGGYADLRGADLQNPYLVLMGLFDAIAQKDVERAAREVATLSSLSQDKIFRTSLKASAALLFDVAGATDKAWALTEEVRAEGGAGFDRAVDMTRWRHLAGRQQWAEAAAEAAASFDESDSPLIRGHRFLHAAQQLLLHGKVDEAGDLLRLVPQSTSSLFLQFLATLAGDSDEKMEVFRNFEEKLHGPPPLKAALQWMLAEGSRTKAEAVDWYRRCIDSDRMLLLPEIELAELVSGKEDETHQPMLTAICEKAAGDGERRWIAAHVAMRLLEQGRDQSGAEILKQVIEASRDEDFVWILNLGYLARGKMESWGECLGKWSSVIEDADALLGVRLLQADVHEHIAHRKDKAEEINKNLMTDGARSVLPFHDLAFHPDHVQDSILFNLKTILEHFSMEGGTELVPAVLSILQRGVVTDPAQRMEIYRKILEIKPGHLPAFCSLRRELLSQGRYEEYFEILNGFLNVSQRLDSGLLGSDRMTLLWLSKQSLVYEEDLRKYLDENQKDPFVPVYLSSIDLFPKLSAEAIEGIASQMPTASSQKWWFDGARKWAGRDTTRMLACLGKLDEESWKRLGVSLVETDAWVRQDWSGITDRLLEQLRSLEEGTTQVPVLSRMAYVDMLLKQDTSIGLAEVQSILQADAQPPLLEMRLLLKHLVAQGRRDEVLPVLLAMSRATKGSEESRIWAWLAYRYGRDDPASADLVYYDLLGESDRLEGDVPLLLLKEVMATLTGDTGELVKILESLALSVEGDREKGSIMWLLSIMLAEADLEHALNFAKEAIDKIPQNPCCAFISKQIAALKEDWSNAAMAARSAGGLFKEPEHAVLELLSAAEIYRDKIGETGWALQCFEKVLAIEPRNDRAFEGLQKYYTESASWDRLAALIESRVVLVEDPGEKLELRYALTDAYEKAGRFPEAVTVVTAVADENPEDARGLKLLADLSARSGQWENAAAALQQLLTLNISDETKVENFMRLGDIYVDQLPDPERAIFCYEKVNEHGPLDLEVAEKLAALYLKTMKWEKGLQQSQMLFENSDVPEEQVKWLIMAGTFFEEGASDMRRAEKAYETARGLAPTAHEPIVHMIRLYRKKNDTMALNFMLQRSVGDMKVFLKKNPDEMTLYHTIMNIVMEAGDATAARLVGTLLSAFNEILPDEKLALQKLGGELHWGGGPWVAAPELEEHLVTASMTPSGSSSRSSRSPSAGPSRRTRPGTASRGRRGWARSTPPTRRSWTRWRPGSASRSRRFTSSRCCPTCWA
jgi:tetratricopeptide (TPR) repeat protein